LGHRDLLDGGARYARTTSLRLFALRCAAVEGCLSNSGTASARRSFALVPTEHPECPEHVPPARLILRFAEPKGECLVVRAIEEPSAIGLPLSLDEMHGIVDACVGFDAGVPEIVDRTKNVR
jgi:hypothetical protein